MKAYIVNTLSDIGKSISIEIERKDGARFILNQAFQPSKETSLEVIVKSINNGAPVNLDLWTEQTPRYGSERHSQVGDSHLYDEEERARFGL